MLASRFAPGQRWLSQTEPELGLGLVLKTEDTTVTIVFPSTDTTRVYTVEGPPLSRVKFAVGDLLKTQDGKGFIVEEVIEEGGRVSYGTKGKKIDESRLSDTLTFSKPYDRMLNAQIEEKQFFNLRHRALYRRFKTMRAPLRGIFNGRYAARPHQIHTVVQATRFHRPRVLLADEQGMGKTIEAALILQRLHTFGNAARVLLIAPEAMLERTALEFSRRFDFHFQPLTEESFGGSAKKKAPAKKAAAKKVKDAKAPESPFENEADEDGEHADLWVSVSLETLAAHKGKHSKEAALTTWDVVIVAGAEELKWDEEGNAFYQAVEPIAAVASSLLLLSSHGPEHDARSHFGRLHLLDTEAFSSLRKLSMHRKEMEPLEQAVLHLLTATTYDKDASTLLKAIEEEDVRIKEMRKLWKEGREDFRDHIIDYLLDAHEAGRFVFRNTRAKAPALPTRTLEYVKMDVKPEVREALKEEFKNYAKPEPSKGKPKAEVSAMDPILAAWVANMTCPPPPPPPIPGAPPEPPTPPGPPPPRVLLLTASRARAVAVEKSLRNKIDGAVELIMDAPRVDQGLTPCIIIIGEEDLVGRSFHGVDKIILWDIPLDIHEVRERLFACEHCFPKMDIVIPCVEDTPQLMTARWLEEGLQAFTVVTEGQVEAAEENAKACHDIVKKIAVKHTPKLDEDLAALITKTAASHEAVCKRLDKGRDHFLEAVSCRIPASEQSMNRLRSTDDDDSLDIFMNRTLEVLGILVETKGPRTVFLKPNPESAYHFEAIPKDGATYSYSRSTACTREDSTLLTWDHPVVSRAIEVLLTTPIGNTAYVVWEDERAQIVLLEGIYLARPKFGPMPQFIGRYMPPTPVRVVISHEYADISSEYTSEVVNKMVRNGRREWIRNNARPLLNIIPPMTRNLTQRADVRMRELASKALFQMETTLTSDIARMKRLPETKARKAEVKRLEKLSVDAKIYFNEPTLVMDQLRIIRRGPSGKGI